MFKSPTTHLKMVQLSKILSPFLFIGHFEKNTGIKKIDYWINFVDNCYCFTCLPFMKEN